jgi:hypothetical protein
VTSFGSGVIEANCTGFTSLELIGAVELGVISGSRFPAGRS